MLLGDIAKNRCGVEIILWRMTDGMGETKTSFILKQLAREEVVSEEQHLKLAQIEHFDSSKLIDVIKETQIAKKAVRSDKEFIDLVGRID